MGRLTINHYALLFAGVILLLFGTYGFYTYQELEESRQGMQQSLGEAAHSELRQAISRLVDTSTTDARAFAGWEEVRQQLNNPVYYAYWRKYRMRSGTLLPDYVENAEVYDVHGQALARNADSALPGHLDKPGPALYVDMRGDHPVLVTVATVHSPPSVETLGFVAIQSRLMPLLLNPSHFRYLDTSSLSIDTDAGIIRIEDLPGALRYQVTQNPLVDEVGDIITTAILRMGLILGTVTLLVYPVAIYVVARPLRRLSQHLRDLHALGDEPVRKSLTEPFRVAELETIRDSLNSYQAQLSTVHASLDEKNKELWNLAHMDALTGVLNRRAFDEHWKHVHEVLENQRLGVCFILFDVNHFKAINDTYGHQLGDQVLKGIAACISGVLRRGAHLYRMGGDEFATVLIDCGREDSLEVAQRCQQAINEFEFPDIGIEEPVRVSIGLAQASAADSEQLRALHWQADAAMYAAKRPGQTHIAIYDESMLRESDSILSNRVVNAVYEAIKDGSRIEMHYQPLVDLHSGRITYYEALIRIRHEEQLIYPDRIMPVVEARRLEGELDRAVIQAVLRDLEQGLIPENTGVSINISGPTIVQETVIHWLEAFQPYLDRYNVVLELTETALITQLQTATEHLKRLQAMGFMVALDDFGSGYSSVRYLASMPVNLVKFDISLIQGLDDDAQMNIVRHLAQMIVEAGYPLVAEGIETPELLRKVRQAGFRFGQGYLFARPERGAVRELANPLEPAKGAAPPVSGVRATSDPPTVAGNPRPRTA